MERIKDINGNIGPSTAPDVKTAFHLIDPATGDKKPIREMSDVQLAAFSKGVGEMSAVRTKTAITRLTQVIGNPLDANMCISMIEQAMSQAAIVTIIRYEQNRRLNAIDRAQTLVALLRRAAERLKFEDGAPTTDTAVETSLVKEIELALAH